MQKTTGREKESKSEMKIIHYLFKAVPRRRRYGQWLSSERHFSHFGTLNMAFFSVFSLVLTFLSLSLCLHGFSPASPRASRRHNAMQQKNIFHTKFHQKSNWNSVLADDKCVQRPWNCTLGNKKSKTAATQNYDETEKILSRRRKKK